MLTLALTDILPAETRRRLYTVLALLGIILAATQAAYTSLGDGQPAWLTAALAAYAVIAAAVGVTARANTHPAAEFQAGSITTGTLTADKITAHKIRPAEVSHVTVASLTADEAALVADYRALADRPDPADAEDLDDDVDEVTTD